MQDIGVYKQAIDRALAEQHLPKSPERLYAPIDYILSLGGKRLRPVLTLMACDCFGGDYHKAVPAALAVELFHNFSLIHDDIMDQAPLRRGHQTVHHKWDLNTGILSGDALLILAYRYFESYPPEVFSALSQLFSQTAIEVCEGQQYDMDFEQFVEVGKDQYLKMINYKTAVLVGAAMKMGAIVAGVDAVQQDLIYEFGRSLGVAFQLQDDYLDAFGDPEVFGKQLGGDILSGKKTYLYITALENADTNQRATLLALYEDGAMQADQKVNQVKALFEATGATQAIQKAIKQQTHHGFSQLQQADLSEQAKAHLADFGRALMSRNV
jgi:geranylgeranyl diphosphate synthase type II